MVVVVVGCVIFFFFKQKTAYELRISDWSSDVCSSDLSASMSPCWPPARTASPPKPACSGARDERARFHAGRNAGGAADLRHALGGRRHGDGLRGRQPEIGRAHV